MTDFPLYVYVYIYIDIYIFRSKSVCKYIDIYLDWGQEEKGPTGWDN